MTVKQLSEIKGFSQVVLSDESREIKGVYIGDLLSWVMGKAKQDDAWITIMSNINVLAVASLADTACVVLAEGVTVDEEFINTAVDKSVNIIKSDFGAYEIAKILLNNGIG